MLWHPPLTATVLTLLVLCALAVMAVSYWWPRLQMDPTRDPPALAAVLLRALAFVLLLIVVLQPARLPRPEEVRTQRTFAVLVDSSASMSLPAEARGEEPSRLAQAVRLLDDSRVVPTVTDQAKLALYSFGARATPIRPDALADLAPAGRQTDIASVLEQIAEIHARDDLAGVLLLSDGRITQGADPREALKRLKVPVLTVALGAPRAADQEQQEQKKDLAIDSVVAEPRIILGRSAQVAVSVAATGYPPRQIALELVQDDAVITTTAVAISPQQPRRQALLTVSPKGLGTFTYQVRIPTESDDTDPTNNLRTFTVEVVDPINRVVYLDSLRSERRFFKPVLEARRNLRFHTVAQLDAQRVLAQGNDPALQSQPLLSAEQLLGLKAVVIGDVPAEALTREQMTALVNWVDKGGALLIMAGPQNLGPAGFLGTPLVELLPVTFSQQPEYLEQEYRVQLTPDGAAHPAFQRVRGQWSTAAPLLSRFTLDAVKPAAVVMMSSTQGEPIVVTRPFGGGKVALVLTDSTWRWQLGFDPRAGRIEGATPHRAFWDPMIDWLLPDLDKDEQAQGQVQIISDRLEYEVGDKVTLLVGVRAADGSIIRNANVELTIATPDGRPISRTAQFDTTAGEASAAYVAQFDAMSEGQYSVQAVAYLGQGVLGTDEVQLSVIQPLLEFVQSDPDRELLADLARLSRGRVVAPDELHRLASMVNLEPRTVKVQPHAQADAKPIWNRWWLAALLVGVMAGEWLIRRKNRWI